MIIRKSDIKISSEIKFGETSARFAFIHELDSWKLSSHADSEGCSGLSLIIYTLNRYCICTFWIESVFLKGNI